MVQVDQAEGGRAKIKAADGGIVTVELRENNSTFETPYCEFQGIVTSPNSLKEESRTHFGGSFGEITLLVHTQHSTEN